MKSQPLFGKYRPRHVHGDRVGLHDGGLTHSTPRDGKPSAGYLIQGGAVDIRGMGKPKRSTPEAREVADMIRYQMEMVRRQLEPQIRAMGLRECARRSTVPQPHISTWLSRGHGLGLQGVSAIARVCGYEMRIVLGPIPPAPHKTVAEAAAWAKANPIPEGLSESQEVGDGRPVVERPTTG